MVKRRQLFPLPLVLSPWLLPVHNARAQPGPYDLTTLAGLVSALDDPRLRNAEQLRTEDEKVMSVIVRDVALVREKITWATKAFQALKDADRTGRVSAEAIANMVRGQLEDIVAQMTRTRRVLESIRLHDARSVRIRPSEWVLDLNGDGLIAAWEESFFALPARHAQARFSNPLNTSREFYAANTSRGVIQVDQADVLWMLAYHNFSEGVLEFLLSYGFSSEKGSFLELKDANRARTRAAPRIEAGFQASRASMQAALAETHDHEEWLPNPSQRNTSFPLPMDAGAFDIWQQVVDSMIALMQSKTLLAVPEGMPVRMAGPLALCPEGMGLDLGEFWRNPPKVLTGNSAAFLPYLLPYFKYPTSAQPVSPLTALLSQYVSRSNHAGVGGEMKVLRYLYWVN